MSPSAKKVLAPWIPSAAYLAHLLDERFFGIGVALWATANTSLYFTNFGWLCVNVPSWILLTFVAYKLAAGTLPPWGWIGLAVHFFLHGVLRIAATASVGDMSPGTLTGALICVPLAIALFARARPVVSGRGFVLGLVAGIASFQPLLHYLLHPFLPHGPS